MPPHGVPDWLYPSSVLQDRDQRTGFIWIQGIYCTGEGVLQAEVRQARVLLLDSGELARVTIERGSRTVPVNVLVEQYAPVIISAAPVYVDDPENEPRLEPFTARPLTGFTRLAEPPGIEGPGNPERGPERISEQALQSNVEWGRLLVASPPRPSSLGGNITHIRNTDPQYARIIDRDDLGLPTLALAPGATMVVRVVAGVPSSQNVAIGYEAGRVGEVEDLPASAWVREATANLQRLADRGMITERDFRAAIEEVQNDPDYALVINRAVETRPGLPSVMDDFLAMHGGTTEGLVETSHVGVGTLMVVRGTGVPLGTVTRLDEEFTAAEGHQQFVHLRLFEGTGGVTEVRLPMAELLETAEPAVRSFEAGGDAVSAVQDFLGKMLDRPLVGRPESKPARTSFERLLEDDED